MPGRTAPGRTSAARRPASARARRYRIAGAGATAAVVAVVVGFSVAHAMLGPSRPGRPRDEAAAVRRVAATWIASQLSRSAVVSCDPVMCATLRAHGVPAASLRTVTPGQGNPLHSTVVVATAAVRADLGGRLATTDAPGVIATFGRAASRIEIRAVATHGPAAFHARLRADLTQRRESGAELLGSDRIQVTGAARTELARGEVDARLLVTLVTLATQRPIEVISFSDAGPGASLSLSPFRAADIAAARTDRAFASSVLSFVRSQHPPFAAARARQVRQTGSRTVVRVEFAAPSPLGLLNGSATQP